MITCVHRSIHSYFHNDIDDVRAVGQTEWIKSCQPPHDPSQVTQWYTHAAMQDIQLKPEIVIKFYLLH